MNFLKRVFATVTGIFVFLILFILIIVIIGMIANNLSKSAEKITGDTVLELKLDYNLKDSAGKVIYKDYAFLNEDSKNGLFDLVNAIDYAANDDNIKGISIETTMNEAGITQLRALREALLRFKQSGKFVTAYADIYTQKDYYLSSVADTVYMSPVGMLEFKGLVEQMIYLKDFQDKSGVRLEVIRLGKYKSAVEPFLENEVSEANKQQILSYLNSLWMSIREDIGKSRNIDPARLDEIADDLLARSPERAVQTGMIDKIGYYSDYENGIRKAIGLKESEKINKLRMEDYSEKIGAQNHYKFNRDRIAVIYAQGEIIYGEGSVDRIGPDEINGALKKAMDDDAIKAVVLRINSPGGSALSSDLIWREVERVKQVKPVVVSMGDFAASGGYYIAAGADRIFAEPSTLTGSIGVFGVLPNVSDLAKNWGFHAHHVGTNKNALTYTPLEPLSNEQRDFILEEIINVYDLFKSRVASGRGMSMEQVEEVAQGRVWTGAEALKNGLVDEIGGMDAALAYAAQKAGITDYQIREYPVYEVDLNKVLRNFGLIQSSEEIAKELLGKEGAKWIKTLKESTSYKGVQLITPIEVLY